MPGGSNVRISDLPPATLPLVGDEQVEITQNGLSRKATTSAIAEALAPGGVANDMLFYDGVLNEWVSTAGLVTWDPILSEFQVTGDIQTSTATGPMLLDQAAGGASPTLIPDRSNPNTGIGHGAGNLSLSVILQTVEALRMTTTLGGEVLFKPIPEVGKTANAGGGQVGATPIRESYSVFSTVASAGDSAILPGGGIVAAELGTFVYVKNDGANDMDVFPNVGGAITPLAINTAFNLPAGAGAFFMVTASNTQWTVMLDPGVSFPLLAPDGSAVAPSYSFLNDTGAGMFLTAPGSLSLAANGVEVARVISGTEEQFAVARSGSSSVPDLTSLADDDTGFWWDSLNETAWMGGGSRSWWFSTAKFYSNFSNGPGLMNEVATRTNPTLVPDHSDPNTGIGHGPSSDEMSLIAGGLEALRISEVAGNFVIQWFGPVTYPSGSAGAAAVGFDGDEDTGMFSPGADSVALTAGGIEAVRYTESGSSIIQRNENDTGITASVTQTQGQQPLLSSYNEVSTVANPNDVVTAPSVAAGDRLLIINNGVNTLQVFPASGDDIGAGVDTSITIISGGVGMFLGRDATNWDTLFNADPDDITFPLLAPNGTAAAPSYSFSGETNTGIYYSGSGVSISVIGTQIMRSDDTGLFGPSAASPTWYLISDESAALDNPIYSFATDNSTGMGGDGAGTVTLIANGFEGIRVSEDTGAITVNVFGDFDVTHTATEDDDAAVQINHDAAGFADAHAIGIDHITGALASGDEEAVILVNIDANLATGGVLSGLEVLALEPANADRIAGLFVTGGIEPVLQLSGTFANADTVLDNAADVTVALSTGGAGNIGIFDADNDTVTVGSASTFQAIEFILGTVASNPGIQPLFEFSTGVGTWAAFSPTDGTNQMRQSGVLAWLLSDIPSWAAGAGGEFLIRITRQRNSLTTTPIADLVQILAATEYKWDANGDITLKTLRSVAPGSGGLEVDAGSGFVRVLNTADLGAGGSLPAGTIGDSSLKWNGVAAWVEETQIAFPGGSTGIKVFDGTLADFITMGHNGSTAGFSVNGATTEVIFGQGGGPTTAWRFNEMVRVPDGSAAVPGITWFGDIATGIYRSALGLSVSITGVEQLRVSNATTQVFSDDFRLQPNIGADSIIMRVNPVSDPNDMLFTLASLVDIHWRGTGGERFVLEEYNLAMEEKANAPADVAGFGQFWVRNDTPNVPMFTDDAGTDHELLGGAGGGLPEFQFFADQFENPVTADWAVNALAPAAADSNNSGLTVRLFDDTTEEGVGFIVEVPATATNIVFDLVSRAETAPGVVNTVGLDIYNRGIPDNAAVQAWSTATAMTDLSIPTNEFFQEDTQTISLATLGVTAGETTQFELVRTAPGAGTDLTGDWDLLLLKVSFT